MTVVNNNSPGGEGEDARKKRGNSQDEREACKKVRSEKKAKEDTVGESDAGETIGKSSQLEDMNSQIKESVRLKVDTSPSKRRHENSPPEKIVWDLESAILYLAQIGNASNKKSTGDTRQQSLKSADKSDSGTRKAATTVKAMDKSQVETSEIIREYLTNEENSWITFRAAHAGDASPIAQWYRKQRSDFRRRKRESKHVANDRDTKKAEPTRSKTSEETNEREQEEAELEKQPLRPSSSNEEENLRRNNSNDSTIDGDDGEEENISSALQLEHWLAEGLGDENTCPFVHGLVAYVHRSRKKENGENDKATTDAENTDATAKSLPQSTVKKDTTNTSDDTSHHMAAVVLMSLSWAHDKRHLKIEWMSIDSSFLGRDEEMAIRQKVWLRIHTLSSMTNCQAISVDEELLMPASTEEKQGQGANEQHEEDEEEPLDGTVSGTASTRKPPFVEPSAE